MNCNNHSEIEAAANCQICAKAYCQQCLVDLRGNHFCLKCRTRPDFQEISGLGQGLCRPGVAFFLGLIPGVGAICNGEYIKAIMHVVIFGFLISIQSGTHIGTFEPLFGMLISAFYFYMPIEAYQTAKRRILEAHGLTVPPSPVEAGAANLWTGVLLMGMGILLFLNTIQSDLVERILRFWPAALIGYGVFTLWTFVNRSTTEEKRK
jgi:hypothetical protein